jgi:hypothetical protein
MERRRSWLAGALAALVLAAGLTGFTATPAEALSGSEFDPGEIISDGVMFNSTTMSEAQIQSFLESKVPTCASGYTCLKSYRQTTTSRAADPMCGAYTGATNERASTILYKVARACSINPQVLLVLLQKEQSLITSTAPSSSKYRSATGYGCPDTAACDAQFYGFYNQVYKAAWAFQRYGMPAGTGPGTAYTTNYNWFPVGKSTAIRYSTKSTCGTRSVTIKNKATAALYYYTPYTPNKAALANLHGTGDGCSSYGNRNFWVYFNDWFGSPVLPLNLQLYVTQVYIDVLGRTPGDREWPGWVRAILRGMPRAQVASGFVNSNEYRLLKIDEAYRDVLGREADEGGRQGWLKGIQQGLTTPDDIYQVFLATQEFYLRNGGTNELYVNGLYELVIGRSATPSERTYWAGMIASKSRKWVVNAIYNAPETRQSRVGEAFLAYVRREATPDEKTKWASYIASKGALAFRAQLLGSTEYWNLAQTGPLDRYDPHAGDGTGDPGTGDPTPTPTPTPTPGG